MHYLSYLRVRVCGFPFFQEHQIAKLCHWTFPRIHVVDIPSLDRSLRPKEGNFELEDSNFTGQVFPAVDTEVEVQYRDEDHK